MEGRRYVVRIEIAYSGGRLPDDERTALGEALRRESPRFSMTVKEALYTVVVVSGQLLAYTSLQAAETASATLDDALYAAGLLEKFDITGKALDVRLSVSA